MRPFMVRENSWRVAPGRSYDYCMAVCVCVCVGVSLCVYLGSRLMGRVYKRGWKNKGYTYRGPVFFVFYRS